jgi:Ca2+-binding RTX toxin-like protein
MAVVVTQNLFNDNILLGTENDLIYASSGNDTINGGTGVDTVDYNGPFGALGVGPITIKPLGVVDKGVKGIDSLIGIETIIGGSSFINTVDSSTATGITSINVNLANNSLIVNNPTIAGFPLSFNIQNFSNVQGTANSDIIFGNANNNLLSGNAGNDSLSGGAGNDTLLGGEGVDTLDGGVGNDSLSGGAGNDILLGGEGVDTLDGGVGNDSLDGGVGNDSLIGGVGNDTVNGGVGVDTVNYTGAFGVTIKPLGVVDKGVNGTDSLVGIENITGNAAFLNTIDSSASTGITTINANLGTNSLVVNNSTIPGFPLSFTVNNFKNVQGTANSDVIVGDANNNLLSGNAGNDNLSGAAGNDTLLGGDGVDTLDGGVGNDSLDGGVGNDSLIGGVGNDIVNGGVGVDTVNYTGAFGVTIKPLGVVDKGVNGTDSLVGIETITGNAAFLNTIDSSASTGITTINANLGTNSLAVINSTIPGFPLNFTVNNFKNVQGTANSDVIVGDANNNLLSGNAGNDNLSGAAGNDTLLGGNGVDTLNGGVGNDSLIGDAGNDSLIGGDGNDTLNGSNAVARGIGELDVLDGGAGFDTYIIGEGSSLFYNTNGNNDFVTIRDNFADGLNIQLGAGAYTIQGNQLFATVGANRDLVATLINNAVVGAVAKTFTTADPNVAPDIAAPARLVGTPVDANVAFFNTFIPQGDFSIVAGQTVGIFSGISTSANPSLPVA